MRNFRSYFGDEARFDFRDRRLLGIVGPIGSGKSSILDAISFALYGKTPTVASATKSLIHQRAADGAVSLRFEVEGEVWEAARLLRIKGQSQHALYRLEADTPTAEAVETITQEGEVNAKIIDLLGLEFDAFRRSVLLAQGRFAEFLSARPAERDKVLKGVFGHDRIDRMRAIARARVGDLEVEIEKMAVRVEHVERVAAGIEEHQAALALATERSKALEAATPRVAELEQQIAEHTRQAAELETRRTELERHAGKLPAPEVARSLADEAAVVGQRRADLAQRLEDAQTEAQTADAAVVDLEESGTTEVIEKTVALLAALTPQEKAVDDLRTRREELIQRTKSLTADRSLAQDGIVVRDEAVRTATASSQEAAERLAQAEAARHAAEHAGMAVTLRAGLAVGEPCPVCTQQVSDIPESVPGSDVELAESELAAARAAREQVEALKTNAVAEQRAAAERLAATEQALQAMTGELEALTLELAEAQRLLAAARDEAAALVGDDDPAAALEQLRIKVRQATAAASDARKKADRIRRDHDVAIRDEQATTRELQRLRLEVADVAARLDLEPAGYDAPAELARAVDELGQTWAEMTRSLAAEAEAARTLASEESEARSGYLAELGISGEFAAAKAETKAQIDLRRAELKRDEAEVAAGAELRAGRDLLVKQQQRYQRIATDLTDSRFVRFLLDEERALLAALGSDHFQRLSSGRYRFSDGGGFDVVDLTAADAQRKADSLSGGETFLASLALALALAEMVARTGGRLDSFFLDEGFGALDPEHLDLAMEGIEALVADDQDRLVVVVSHVPELRHRIEDLIELDRDPTTGDTRILSA